MWRIKRGYLVNQIGSVLRLMNFLVLYNRTFKKIKGNVKNQKGSLFNKNWFCIMFEELVGSCGEP